jgi:hypothetical protein
MKSIRLIKFDSGLVRSSRAAGLGAASCDKYSFSHMTVMAPGCGQFWSICCRNLLATLISKSSYGRW